ncbi:hypothetical protein V7S43_007937 [Phytophthora oleae]|uniref:Uncharacterized protein n=1 Tax=Phytophthora oleae TaxID=2107226 RepID=A0ABD3FJ96_9STRA
MVTCGRTAPLIPAPASAPALLDEPRVSSRIAKRKISTEALAEVRRQKQRLILRKEASAAASVAVRSSLAARDDHPSAAPTSEPAQDPVAATTPTSASTPAPPTAIRSRDSTTPVTDASQAATPARTMTKTKPVAKSKSKAKAWPTAPPKAPTTRKPAQPTATPSPPAVLPPTTTPLRPSTAPTATAGGSACQVQTTARIPAILLVDSESDSDVELTQAPPGPRVSVALTSAIAAGVRSAESAQEAPRQPSDNPLPTGDRHAGDKMATAPATTDRIPFNLAAFLHQFNENGPASPPPTPATDPSVDALPDTPHSVASAPTHVQQMDPNLALVLNEILFRLRQQPVFPSATQPPARAAPTAAPQLPVPDPVFWPLPNAKGQFPLRRHPQPS